MTVDSAVKATDSSAKHVAGRGLLNGKAESGGASLNNFADADVVVRFANNVRALRTMETSRCTSLAVA